MHPLCKNRHRPQVHEIGPLIASYYQKPENTAGGICHVVLDDANIEDSFIESCLADCKTKGDDDGAQIMQAMLDMTKTQRLKVLKYRMVI